MAAPRELDVRDPLCNITGQAATGGSFHLVRSTWFATGFDDFFSAASGRELGRESGFIVDESLAQFGLTLTFADKQDGTFMDGKSAWGLDFFPVRKIRQHGP